MGCLSTIQAACVSWSEGDPEPEKKGGSHSRGLGYEKISSQFFKPSMSGASADVQNLSAELRFGNIRYKK
jgi:hypothetical protein